MWSNFRMPQPTNHALYVVFEKELRQVEIGIWKENLHGNTKEFQWVLNGFYMLYHCVAVRVFFPDTDLRLPQLLFEYNLECMISWLRHSEI